MQLNGSDHRIYQHLSKPFRFMGLTIDEILLFTGSFIMIYVSLNLSILFQGLFALTGTVGVALLKKAKKAFKSFSMKSFLHWHLGYMATPSSLWPRSYNRFWLS